jgi:hypothetical protein
MSDYEFDHVGITTTVQQPQEDWVEASKIWVTNPRDHPEHIEFLRYREDSPVPDAVRYNPPFVVGDFLEVVFVRKHGMVFEYMRYLKDGWFGN